MVSAKSLLVPFRYSHKVAYIVEFSHHKIRLYAEGKLIRTDELENPLEGIVPSDDPYVLFGVESGSHSSSGDEEVKIQMTGTGQISVNGVIKTTGSSGAVYKPFEIETPYTYEDLWDDEELCWKIQTIQNCDVLYIFHERHPIKVLKRYANDDWRLEDLELIGGPFEAVNTEALDIKSSGVDGEVTLTATDDLFKPTDVGRLIRFHAGEDGAKVWSASKSFSKNDICYSDKKYYKAVNTGTSGSDKPSHTEGVRTDGGVQWKYLHDGTGVVRVKSFTSAKSVLVKVCSLLPQNMLTGTPMWELGMLHDGANYPISGAFFRNRFAFLVNTDTGPNVCLSVNGDYNNFSDRVVGEATAETAITVPVLGKEFNEGKWIFSGNVLFVGTGAAEFYIDVISGTSAMSADNIKIQQISSVGSKAIMPVAIGGHIFFADRYGLTLRDLVYNYYNDGYDQIDMSLLGKHLFVSRIVSLSYQETPDKILWCLMGDGTLTALTFSAEQEVAALSRHDFSGVVESLVVIPNLLDARDEMWIEVKRLINSKTIRSVEWVENGMPQSYPLSVTNDMVLLSKNTKLADYTLKQAAYLDGAVLFERGLANEGVILAGLSHLEGEVVSLFADGVVLPPQMVIDGKVELKKAYTRVLVGMPMVSQYIPQSMYVQTNTSFGIGQKQRINHVLFTFYLSGGGKLGQDENSLIDILYRNTDAPMDVSQALFSGNKEILFNGATSIHEQAASIFIENTSPLPMNILAIVPSIDIS